MRALRLAAAALVVLCGGGASAQTGSASLSLEQRVQRIEDRVEIERLLLDYGAALDRGDFASYAALFAENGTWTGTTGSFTGRAAIEAGMIKAFSRPSGAGPRIPSFHLLTNAMIDVDGDTATAVSKWNWVRVIDRKPAIVNSGSYNDRFVREKGRWRFASRSAPSLLTPADP